MLALVKHAPGPGRISLEQVPEPSPGAREVVIGVAAAGICGSDLHIYHGTTRLFPKHYPAIIGHEYAGVVLAVGEEVTEVRLGDRVTAEPSWGCGRCRECVLGASNRCPQRTFHASGFAERVAVPARCVHPLPDGIDLLTGVLSEPLACVVHGLAEAVTVEPGSVCVVIGPGPLGLLAALTIQALGARAALVGRTSSRHRLALAEALGIDHVINSDETDLHEAIAELTPDGADLVVDCAGSPSAWQAAWQLARSGGTCLELALNATPVNLRLDALVAREITLKGALSHRPSSWRRALELVRDGLLPPHKLTRLVTATYPLVDWERGFQAAAGRREAKVALAVGSY